MTANRIADAQKQLDTLIRTAYAKAFPDKEMRDFIIEIPKDTSHGDFASNAAMVNAKNAGKAPRDIARRPCWRTWTLPAATLSRRKPPAPAS